MAGAEPKVLDVATADEWERWLEAHHGETDEGVWLVLRNKQAATPASLTYVQAVEVALCFGWIDGQGRKHGEGTRVQRFTPRRKRSVWSKVNVERAGRLVAEGRMRPAGLAEIERAKADGRWANAYDPPSTAELPADFLAELEKHPKAKAFFATLDKRNTYPVVHRLQTAVKPETRANRLAKIIEMFDRGERFYE